MPKLQRRQPRQATPTLVAIPARDEADEIGPCLLALAKQTKQVDGVVLCLNNCRDDTASVVRAHAGRLPFPLSIIEETLPAASANAGHARRIAMERAAAIAGHRGVLLTTDADARVPPAWVAANLAAIMAGADAVAGRAVIEPEGAKLIPCHLHAIDAREGAYATLLDEICALVDPDPADPWPRHDEESGASVAVTVAAYRRAGGIPATALGEDRAFFDSLRRVDARIRHAPEISVLVSARVLGRAIGGMADTMSRRIERPDPFLDHRLETALDALRRVHMRRLLRDAWSGAANESLTPSTRVVASFVSRPAQTGRLRYAKPRTGVGGRSDPALGGVLNANHGQAMTHGSVIRPPGITSDAARFCLSAERLAELLAAPCFGSAWAILEAESTVLRDRRKVPLEALARQTSRARCIRDRLLRRLADRADSAIRVAAE